jgi:hypothetical protein
VERAGGGGGGGAEVINITESSNRRARTAHLELIRW